MAADSASRAALLRKIPSVDELLGRPLVAELSRRAGRALVLDVTRQVLAAVRAELSEAADPETFAEAASIESLERRIAREVEAWLTPLLRPVINATGVVLHTNLGRAPLSTEALDRLRDAAASYSNLEYDLATGARGKRDVHTDLLVSHLVGAEAAIVVNNNAAAVFLGVGLLRDQLLGFAAFGPGDLGDLAELVGCEQPPPAGDGPAGRAVEVTAHDGAGRQQWHGPRVPVGDAVGEHVTADGVLTREDGEVAALEDDAEHSGRPVASRVRGVPRAGRGPRCRWRRRE